MHFFETENLGGILQNETTFYMSFKLITFQAYIIKHDTNAFTFRKEYLNNDLVTDKKMEGNEEFKSI